MFNVGKQTFELECLSSGKVEMFWVVLQGPFRNFEIIGGLLQRKQSSLPGWGSDKKLAAKLIIFFKRNVDMIRQSIVCSSSVSLTAIADQITKSPAPENFSTVSELDFCKIIQSSPETRAASTQYQRGYTQGFTYL